jgi:serine/threonine protein kinase/Tol biopolymer transport system component
MTADRWQDVARIYNAAMELGHLERSKYIADASGGDEDIRREVESLFAQDREHSVLDRPMVESMPGLLPPETVLPMGARLGPYEIDQVIGGGGMGHVYRATDTRLQRTVAIKVLRGALSTDPQFRERFEREAKVIASLTHPHICALYDVRSEDDVDFLVLEYLEGETLAARLTRGELPLDHVLRHAVEIAEALATAHRKGIVHRDLKPGNVVLTKAGAKLLDFGLAKPMTPPIRSTDASAMPTIAREVTAEGTILGTVQYMAPEQLEGRTADARTDIFAFGAVVYEMVAGRKAFEGGSPASVIGAILKDQPRPLDESHPLTPPLLDHIVSRCLAKDPDERWQNAADLARELRWLAHSSSATRAPHPGNGRPRLSRVLRNPTVAWLATATVTVAALATTSLVWKRPSSVRPVVTRFAIPLPDDAALASIITRTGNAAPVDPLAISRDGRKIAFVAESPDGVRRLWIRTLDSLETHAVGGTERANGPFWSPDSRFVAFFADGTLKKVDLAGGAPVVVCEVRSSGASGSWNTDDVMIFQSALQKPLTGSLIYRVSAGGGTPSPVTELGPGELTHSRPVFLPDERHFLYYAFSPGDQNPDRPKHPVLIGSLDSKEHRKLLVPDAVNVGFSQGHLLFMRDTTLMAQPFDIRTLSFSGDAFPAARDVKMQPGNPTIALFAASENGVLVYQSGVTASESELVWFDRTGRPTARLGEAANFAGIRISPDGQQVAATVLNRSSTEGDIWFYSTSTQGRTRFTFDPAIETSLVWAANGRHVVVSVRPPAMYRQSADGGPQEWLNIDRARSVETPGRAVQDWSPDGRFVLFFAGGELWTLPLFGDRQASRWIGSPGTQYIHAQFDPTGRWVAYESNEAGKREVYVAAFPGPGVKRQISADGGVLPRWRRDGRELFYITPDDSLMSAAVRSNPSAFDVTDIHALFRTRRKLLQNGSGYPYDVSADGTRFLINTTPEETASTPLTVVLNWMAGL